MLVLDRVGNCTIWCLTAAFVNGKVGATVVNDVAETLAEGGDWGSWDAKQLAHAHGIEGSGPNGAFVTSDYRA